MSLGEQDLRNWGGAGESWKVHGAKEPGEEGRRDSKGRIGRGSKGETTNREKWREKDRDREKYERWRHRQTETQTESRERERHRDSERQRESGERDRDKQRKKLERKQTNGKQEGGGPTASADLRWPRVLIRRAGLRL